jgi:polar amino acid transport system ATP-binding protein
VFQQFHLFPHLSVLGNVIEAPMQVLGISRDQAESEARELLDRVGLGDKLSSRPQTLSGGQQQRVAIVRALALKPAVVLFDEPTSALDPRMTAEVTRWLLRGASPIQFISCMPERSPNQGRPKVCLSIQRNK